MCLFLKACPIVQGLSSKLPAVVEIPAVIIFQVTIKKVLLIW